MRRSARRLSFGLQYLNADRQEIALKGKAPSNLAFGGNDGRTVIVTQRQGGFIKSFRTDQAGREFAETRLLTTRTSYAIAAKLCLNSSEISAPMVSSSSRAAGTVVQSDAL